ncbi:MAG TPA: O-antigen ligase family protein, partial [Solirubrobacterales bacterium]
AWEGAARTALFAAIFTLAVAVPWRRSVQARLGSWLVIGAAVVAGITLLGLLLGGAGDLFLAGRLNEPVGYRNGTAALFAFAVWPLIGIAARRGVQSGLRASALAATVLALGLAFLTQSRGVLLGLVAGGCVSLLIGADRVRRAWLCVAALAGVALASGALLAPFHAFDGGVGRVTEADIHSAALALLLLSGCTFLAALLVSVLDNGLRADVSARVRGRQLATAGLLALALAAGAIAIVKVGNPVSYASDKLDEFTNLDSETTSAGGLRLGTVGGQRYDLYSIAWDQFLEHPVAGAGEGSYRFAYYRDRHTDRNLSDPHSEPLRLLADTGLIGFALFAIWLACAGVAIARQVRTGAPSERLWTAGLAAAATTVIVQSFVDWLWLLPGLFGLAVLALGLAASGSNGVAGEQRASRRRPGVGRLAIALALGLALASVTLLFLSDLYLRKARVESLSSPQAAYDSARMAERLNPVSVRPLYLQASALETEGNRAGARAALQEALKQEPSNFATLGLLGDLEVRAGHDRRARAYYRASLELNPEDIGLRELSHER